MMVPDSGDLPPRLRCADGELIKPNGYPVILRGVNFGAWGQDEPIDVEQVTGMGANVVRIALRWHGKYGRDDIDSRDNNGFAFIRQAHFQRWLELITAASAAGLWTIPFIDSDCVQSGTQNPETVTYCDPYGQWGARGRNGYTDPSLRRLFTTIVWPAAAARLRTIARIAMLEIHPEPAGERGPEYTQSVAKLQRECIAAIRAVDTDTPILVGARQAYNIDIVDEAVQALGEVDDKLVWTGNQLSWRVMNAEKFDAGMASLVAVREKYGVPVFCQQLGRKTGDDRDLAGMRRALERTDAEKVGYAWWQWKQNTSDPNEYGLNFKTEDGAGWVQKANEVALLTERWGNTP